jgi:uncharacterized UPF0160 family protein
MEKLSFIPNKDLFIYNTEDLNQFLEVKNTQAGKKLIATHSGSFHADEVLACVMTKHMSFFTNSWIIRSRNYEILKHGDLVCDVGGVFDPSTMRYDHHMKEFTEVFEDTKKMKMSSAGLVFKFHGREIIKNILISWDLWEKNEAHIEDIFKKIYENFICYVDANDNGINQYPDDIKPLYPNNTSFANRIGRANPDWYESNPDFVSCFRRALDVAEDEFLSQLAVVVKSHIPGKEIVLDSIKNRTSVHESGKILFLKTSCPWKEHLFNLEEDMNMLGEIQFVIYGSYNEGFRVQTVPLSLGNFKFRRGLKESWRGVKPEDIRKESGIEDLVFVHNSGFIGGAKSFESAVKMAVISLSE